MSETVRFTYRLRPGRIAQAALLGEWGRCRWLWNEAVHQQRTGRKPTFGKLSKLLTEARSRNAWLREGSQVDLPHLGHRKRCAAELAKAQRRMARRRRPKGQKASKGYLAAKAQAARIGKRAARQNTHDARVWAKTVVEHHGLIAVEDFKPRFLAKTSMARKAADNAIGACEKELIERGVRAGGPVVLVPPAYTTMTCSGCGERANLRLGLGVRTFECTACGYTAGRDLNAARTILATAERGRASADDVRHRIASFRDGGSDAVRAGNPEPQGSGGKSPGFIRGDR
ncbi:transposase [Actinoplanes sp. NPDC051851]|uniref:transposase n=1 Tax=Actinoplanes sp. NPDC051851 TaxID=3154753 RepID=UPI003439D2E7